MDNFNFYSPTEFVFGKDRENECGAYVKKYGGWCDWDEVNRLRKADKARKKDGCSDNGQQETDV